MRVSIATDVSSTTINRVMESNQSASSLSVVSISVLVYMDVRVVTELGQIAPQWDKSGNF